MKWWIGLLLTALSFSQAFALQYSTFEENGKVGMKDNAGNVVLPPTFEALGWSDGKFSVTGEVTGYRLNGLWGIINLKKEFVTKAEYEKLIYSGGESIVARKKINTTYYKTGCLNLRGEIKIPFMYDGISVQGLRAIVFNLTNKGYQYGLIDFDNKFIVPMQYKSIATLGTLRYAVENNEGKIALYSEEGKPVTDFAIDSISSFYKGYAIVYKDHLQGLIDREGKTKVETKYQSIKISSEGKISVLSSNEWIFINEKNETIKQIFADELKPLDTKHFYIKKGNEWGIVDEEFKIVVPINYESISKTEHQNYLAKRNDKFGVIDNEQKTIIPFLYDSLLDVKHGFFAFNKIKGWQLLDRNGKILTDRFYEQMQKLNEQNFLVSNKGFFGAIDSQGKLNVHCVYDSILNFADGLVAVKFKNKYGIITFDESWLVAPQDFPLQVVNEKVFLQKQPNNQFIKTYSGEIKYYTPYPLQFNQENFVETLPNGIKKTIGYDGIITERKEVVSAEKVFHESEGFIGFKKDDRYGFVDAKGRLRVANRYDSIGEFHEGLAAIKLIGKWGFVNDKDQIIINPNYDEPTYFQNGMAVVSRNKKFGVIDKNGNAILPLRYDDVTRLTNSFLLTKNNLKGLTDAKAQVIIDTRYDFLEEVKNNLLVVCKDGKCGTMTVHGVNIIPIMYDELIFDAAKGIFFAEKKSAWKEIN